MSLVVFSSSLAFGCFVFLAGLFDGVDGAVARESGTGSARGAFTDSVVDKISELLILLGVLLRFLSTTFLGLRTEIWVFLSAMGWLLTSYTRARAEGLGVEDLDVGLAGRSERLLILVLFSVFGYVLWGLVVVCLLSLATAGYRAYHYRTQLAGPKHGE
jgi:phosphatidylglycerophosphate synthase